MSLHPINESKRYSRKSGRSLETQKFIYDCQGKISSDTNPWLKIIEKIHVANSLDSGVLKGILDKHRYVAVKFGNPMQLQEDYDQAARLFNMGIPNCLKYYCFFTCKDDIKDITNRTFADSPYLCQGPGNNIGLIMMPYYPIGSINQYHWKPDDFSLLQNVLKQVIYAMIEMYRLSNGYVHPDLHLDNIILRKTDKKILVYGQRNLVLQGYYAVIIDFEPRKTGVISLLQAVSKLMNLALSVTFPNHIIQGDARAITMLKFAQLEYPTIFESVDSIIDAFKLQPIPKMPF
jgi:serine/threonine protein kinase